MGEFSGQAVSLQGSCRAGMRLEASGKSRIAGHPGFCRVETNIARPADVLRRGPAMGLWPNQSAGRPDVGQKTEGTSAPA